MILELATIKIIDGQNVAFESALEKAKKVIERSKGFVRIEVNKCVEEPEIYTFFIHWETLEDHTIGFRGSDLFTQWRSLIGPFFASPPQVLHYETVL